jgi:hypothetical protein
MQTGKRDHLLCTAKLFLLGTQRCLEQQEGVNQINLMHINLE